MAEKKILVAYYSHSGNTKKVAELIHAQLGGNVFEIVPTKAYPNDYNSLVQVGKQEKEQNIYPEINENADLTAYDTIFVGTPVWWYTMAGPLKTFLKENDFAGKTIVPFCTHGGGGASNTYSDIKKLAPAADVLEGYTSYEDSANEVEVKKWIDGLVF